MTKDLNRGIEEIRYNFLNLPSKITFTEKNAYIRNMYDANGHKFKMITYANIPLVIGRAAPAKASAVNKARAVGLIPDSLVYDTPFRNKFIPDGELRGVPGMTTYDYCGNIVYKNGVPTIYREEGYTTVDARNRPVFRYYIRDHQGNIRGVTDGRGNIEQQNDYYPFGGMMASSTGGAVQPYRYTGKELVRFQGLDWLDYGARWYDPATLRWNAVDPMAEKYTTVSPYNFCLNDPVKYKDTDGRRIILSGNRNEQMTILKYLQRLTNDNLYLNRITGEVTIGGKRWDNRHKKLNVGTSLLRDVINHDRTTKIQIGEEGDWNRYHASYPKDELNGKGTDGYINLNPTLVVELKVQDSNTGNTIEERAPMEIIVGHELIHAFSAMNGNTPNKDEESSYVFKDVDRKYYIVSSSRIELGTVGIIGDNKYTENKLRKEQGLNKRVKY